MVCSGEGKIEYGQVVSELIQGEGEKKKGFEDRVHTKVNQQREKRI